MKSTEEIWAIVYVWRGLPSTVELYSDYDHAQQRAEEMRSTLSLEDEIGIIEAVSCK